MTKPAISENTPEVLRARLHQVRQRIVAAEQKAGREPGEVRLLAVSKTRPAEDVARVARLGLRAFGESYLQEAEAKIVALKSLDLEWHFIGPVQSNKTQAIARLFAWVHSVDREKIARRLSEQRPADIPPLNICLQVNISGEASKSGVPVDALPALAAQIMDLPRLRLCGLMAIPAASSDTKVQRAAFRKVREALIRLNEQFASKGLLLDTLSMGMSQDFEAAIAEGATMVRVGTDIFGPRVALTGNLDK